MDNLSFATQEQSFNLFKSSIMFFRFKKSFFHTSPAHYLSLFVCVLSSVLFTVKSGVLHSIVSWKHNLPELTPKERKSKQPDLYWRNKVVKRLLLCVSYPVPLQEGQGPDAFIGWICFLNMCPVWVESACFNITTLTYKKVKDFKVETIHYCKWN